MNFSESSVLLLVYTGLMIFFLVPSQREEDAKNLETFKVIYKGCLMKMIFQRKAIFAFLLLSFSLLCIWLAFGEVESHTNRHSGNPPISTNLEAINMMFMMLIYTIILYLSLALVRTLKLVKSLRL